MEKDIEFYKNTKIKVETDEENLLVQKKIIEEQGGYACDAIMLRTGSVYYSVFDTESHSVCVSRKDYRYLVINGYGDLIFCNKKCFDNNDFKELSINDFKTDVTIDKLCEKDNLSLLNEEPSDVLMFRKKWLESGYDLVNITTLCEPKLGISGWCNGLNEPDETIHHIQLWYRGEVIASMSPSRFNIIDEDLYTYMEINEDDPIGSDFILFMLVPLSDDKIDEKLEETNKLIRRLKNVNK